MTTHGGRRRNLHIDTPEGRMTPLRYEIRQMLRKHPDEQGYIIARALDTTPGYVSKVRKEAAMDAKTHPVLDVVHTVTRGGENEI